jgi:LysM repeat protein
MPVVDKGPKTPEQLASINAQRAASGEQAADIAAHQARMASGLYANPTSTAPTPTAPTPTAPTPTAPTPTAPTAPTAPTPTAPQPKATSWQQIYAANKDVIGPNPNLIKPGQKLTMPDGSTYTVAAGDNLSKIAAKSKPTAQKSPATELPAGSKIITPVVPQSANTPSSNTRDNFAQANAYLDRQEAAAKQKWVDNRSRAQAARQRSDNANLVVDKELARMDKATAAIKAGTSPASQYYVQPSKVGMNGEMDYVVVDRTRGLEVKSFDSQAEADAWIKQQPVSESLSRILTIAGLK